jgi:hypothetical protein
MIRLQRQLFTDVMLVHINRLFAQHQRTHEIIFYDFWAKILKQYSAGQNRAQMPNVRESIAFLSMLENDPAGLKILYNTAKAVIIDLATPMLYI